MLCSALLCSVPVFFMNCVKCGRFSYFKMEAETCDACHQRQAERQAKMARLKKTFGTEKNSGNPYDLNWAVIQCITRERLSYSDTAEVLGVDERTVELEMDIARQNAG